MMITTRSGARYRVNRRDETFTRLSGSDLGHRPAGKILRMDILVVGGQVIGRCTDCDQILESSTIVEVE